MKKPFLVFTLLFSLLGYISAQERALGTWQSFIPYGSATQVTQSADRVYCATPYNVFYVEKSDGSVGILTKSNGLNDADVVHIAYNTPMNTLVITYANSDIDLLVNGNTVYNIPDIKNAIISGSKNINDICMIGNYAYLATDLGISVLDLNKQEISENYIIGQTGLSVKVNSLASDGNTIFAATAEGLKSASLSSPNLQDYAVWTIYGSAQGLPSGASDSLVGQINGRFYTVINNTLYADTTAVSGFARVRTDSIWSYTSFCNTGGYLYAIQWANGLYARLLKIQPNDSIAVIGVYPSIRPQQMINDGSNFWLADNWAGLRKFDANFNYTEIIRPDGPPDNGVFRLAASHNTLYMAAGGTDPGYDQLDNDPSGPIVYDHRSWRNYPPQYYPSISGCLDLVDVAVDDARHIAYYGSMSGGLVELDLTTNTVTKFDTSNSPLGKFSGLNETRVSALCLDHSGNLWMSNTGTPQSLVMKTPNNVWSKFTVPNDIYRVRKMIVDSNGYVWMAGRTGGANIIVFNPADSQFVNITSGTGNGALNNSDVWTMASDKEGNVWVGNDIGISTFYCTGSLFAGTPPQAGCDATLIKVDEGGYIGYLFSTEIVQAIAVDGADRKWVGTTNGVWLISADGTQQLLNFNTSNSPIPNNSISDITVDQQTGEVWIGTADGLVSYQGDAILGGGTKGTALVYPNPVKPDYTGPIAIKGLVDNAYVKITDISGTLVYQGRANGGQMIWNGQGYSGNKVSSGVYMVFADADDGSQHNVAKIIFIK